MLVHDIGGFESIVISPSFEKCSIFTPETPDIGDQKKKKSHSF